MTAIPIVALDVPAAREALALVQVLGERCQFYKVGSELFTAAGPQIVRALRELGNEVFLDIKLHDIPNTVRGAARSAANLGASLLTVHASGGETMIRAAVEGAGTSCRILGVTVLTSFDAASLGRAWGRGDDLAIDSEVLRLADSVSSAGAHGVVCSGLESPRVRERFGKRLATLVPGIRFADGAAHDQSRVMTPRGAVEAGATYLILGRAVIEAPDPRGAMDRVWSEIAGVASS